MGAILHLAVPQGFREAMGTPEERLMPSQAPSRVFQHLQGVLPMVISPGCGTSVDKGLEGHSCRQESWRVPAGGWGG